MQCFPPLTPRSASLRFPRLVDGARAPQLRTMMKQKLNWKRPLFFLLLPIFLVMIFLGFPLPVAPPPATMVKQEQSMPEHKRKKRNKAHF